jgi:hypothetical protein
MIVYRHKETNHEIWLFCEVVDAIPTAIEWLRWQGMIEQVHGYQKSNAEADRTEPRS